MVSPPLFSWTSTPTMQFVVNVMNQKVICHDNNQLLAFGTRMLPPPGGLLTRLSMVVALVFGRCMLTYGMWQWGHTGAAGRTILMMSTKKEMSCQAEHCMPGFVPLQKDKSGTRAFIKNISHSQNPAGWQRRAWQMLTISSETGKQSMGWLLWSLYFRQDWAFSDSATRIEHIARSLVAVHTESIFVFTNCMKYRRI